MPENKSYHKYMALICALFCSLTVHAQTVSGSVIAAETSQPLEGVTISVENKGIGSATNSEGKFVIVLHDVAIRTDSLTFSYVGFIQQKISIADALANNNQIVKLKESITDLKEVVVKPLSLKSLLDSIAVHNRQVFASPADLKGYYREIVYTNSKCSEYSDALCEYYFDRSKAADGQFKINASRCLKEKKTNDDKQDFEAYVESFIDPNLAFKYALLTTMISARFPDKVLDDYDYDMQQTAGDLKIIILPKRGNNDALYQLTLFLKNDFTLQSYHLEIPQKLAYRIKEKSLLGIHVKRTGLSFVVNYTSTGDHIYPNYYSMAFSYNVTGKFMGTVLNQAVENKSEFVVTGFNNAAGIAPFERKLVYKKGNICNNGAAINDALLKDYTIIKLTQKDSSAIKSFISK